MALLRIGQLLVQFLETGFAQRTALLQLVELRLHLGELTVQLRAPRLAGLGLLRQAQQLHLRLVRAGLCLGCLAPRRAQAQRGLGVRRLGAYAAAARLVGDQPLRAHLALQVLDLLLARQHAGLLGIRRVEGHRVLRHRVAFARHDHFAMRQLAARGQRLVQAAGGVHAFEPVVQQRLQAGVVQTQQLGQARQRAVRVGMRAGAGRIEGQPRRRRIGGEGAHRLQPADLQRVQPFAQRGFEHGFPAGLDMHAGPQALQPVETMLQQPRLELAAALHLLLQRTQRFQPRVQLGPARGFLRGTLS